MKNTQKVVYDWLMQNPGEHTVQEIAEGLGSESKQAGNACSQLKVKNAAANHGNAGIYTKWFAIPGVDFTNKGSTDRKTGAQAIIYDWLTTHPGAYATSEIAEGCGLTSPTTSSACVNLRIKGAAILTGYGIHARWSGVPNIDIGARRISGSVEPRKSPGATALAKFEKALEMFIDAAIEIKDYIVVEDVKAELEELRAFKLNITQAMRTR